MPAPNAALAAVSRRLACSPAEAVALGILAAAAVAAVGLLWVLGRAPSPPGPVGVAPSDGPTDGPGVVMSDGDVIVHVAGAVAKPGVYTLPGGSRVADAVAAAGGARRDAVLDGLNLARPLTDGEQVLVTDRKTARAQRAGPGTAAGQAPSSNGAAATTGTVSLNSATVADLETLPGIGPVLAERIISHRDSIGGFKEVGELRDVPGIGEKTFQSLAPLVSL